MTFTPTKFDHDYSLAVLDRLTGAERAAADAHVVKLNGVCAAWACNDQAAGSRKSFERSYYALGAMLRSRGASYPPL